MANSKAPPTAPCAACRTTSPPWPVDSVASATIPASSSTTAPANRIWKSLCITSSSTSSTTWRNAPQVRSSTSSPRQKPRPTTSSKATCASPSTAQNQTDASTVRISGRIGAPERLRRGRPPARRPAPALRGRRALPAGRGHRHQPQRDRGLLQGAEDEVWQGGQGRKT